MPKGLLNRVILFVITTFTGLTIIVAGAYIGYTLILEGLKAQLHSNNSELQIRAEKLADFSRIPAGYSVTKAVDIVGVKVVVANYNYNGQVMCLVDPAWVLNINKKDITIHEVEEKVKSLISLIDKQDTIKIEDFMVTKFDSFNALKQTIPYMKVTFSASGNYSGDYRGIIGILKNSSTNRNNLIIAYNTPKDYNQYTAERFFQGIEFK